MIDSTTTPTSPELPGPGRPDVGFARKFARHAGIYSLESLLFVVLPLILTPLFLRCLSTAQYGVMEILNNTTMLASSLLRVGLSAVIARAYLQELHREQDRRDLVTSLLAFELVLGALVVVASFFGAARLSVWLTGSAGYGPATVLAFGLAAAMAIRALPQDCLRLAQRGGGYLAASFVQMALLVLLNLGMLGVWRLGVMGVEAAAVLAALGSLPIALFFLRDRLVGRFRLNLLKRTLTLSFPVMLVSVAPWALNVSDRYFLVHARGAAITGIYALGYKLGNLACTVCRNAVQSAWEPLYFTMSEREGADAYRKMITVYVALMAGVVLLTAAGSPVLLALIGRNQYLPALGLILPVGLAYMFDAVATLLCPLFLRVWSPIVPNVAIFIAAIITVVCEVVLIPRFGMAGGVESTLAGFAFYGVATSILAYRRCGLRLDGRVLAGVLAGAALAGWALESVPAGAWLPGLALRLLAVAGYAAVVALVLGRDEQYRRLARQFRRRG